MDKKLLDALSNLSIGLEYLAQAIQDGNKSKTATSKALSGGDLDKKIISLQKSVEDIISSNKLILKTQEKLVQILKKQTQEVKSVESNPIKYGEAPTLPEMAKIEEQIIPLKYGTLPNQPTIPAIPKQIIGLEYENIGKFIPPQPDKVIIPTEYGEPTNKDKITKAPNNTVEKQGKENDLFDRAGDGQKKQGIKDGVGMIMLIAVAVLAIGMAFKLIGGINIGTVLSLSIAIPLLALAFAKVSTYEELTMRRAIELTGVMVALATALVLTSVILRAVAPVGIIQIMSAIGIAGIFTVLSFGLGQLVESVQGMGSNATKSLFLLPIIMPAISLAILLSSYILSAVSPIGMPQIISSIAIAGVFFVLGYGIKSLVDGVSGLGTGSLKALALMPIVLTALSLSIMLSSYILSAVAPVGLPQLFTAIAIAGVFTVLSYGLGQIFQGLSSFGIKSLILLPFLPLIFVSLSLSIALSSYVLGMVRPVGILQLLTAIMIAGVFAVIGFGLGKLINSMKELKNPAMAMLVAAAMPILLVAVATAITLSSFLFAAIKPINFAQFLTAVGISLIFIPISFALPFISKAISQVSLPKIALMPIILVAMATVILLTSQIFAKVVPIPFATLFSITLLSITIAAISFVFGFAFKFIGNISTTSLIKGGLTMVGIAVIIFTVSKILAKGDYTKFPSLEWTVKTAVAIGVFGLAMVLLGNAVTANPLALPAGLLAVVSLALTIVVTSKILAKGDYSTFPSIDWVKGVGASMGIFGLATVTLGSLVVGTLGLGGVALAAGAAAVITLAETIVKVANIFAGVDFSGGPKKEWAEGVGVALGAFSPVYNMMMKNKIFELFGGGGMGPEEFATSIVTLSTAIVKAADIIRGGIFTGGPKKEWAEGVAIAIGGFSKVYQMLLVNGIAKLFGGGGMGPDEFSKAIITISTAIRDSSFILKLGTYVGAPKKEWAEGVAIAIGGFSKVYQMLLVNGIAKFFGGGGMGPNEFSKAIVAISTAIRDSSFILKAGTYVGAPSKEWAEGVAIAIGGFSKVYQMLLVNGIAKFFGGGGMGPDEFSKAIVAISTAIRDSSFILKSGTYQGAPTKEWAEGVAIALGGFSKVYQMLLVNGIAKFFGGGGMGPDEFSKAIVAISTAIRDSSFILKSGTYQGAPTKEWAEGVSLGIGGFSQVYGMLMKNSIMDMFGGGGMGPEDFAKAIESVSRGLLVASELLAQGTFTGGPTKQWSEGVALGIGGFSQVYGMLMKNSIMKMFGGGGMGPEEFGKAIGSVSEGLLVASEKLSKGKFVGGPTKAWSEGVAAGLGGFSAVYKMLETNSIFEFFGAGGLSPQDFSKAIEVVSEGIVASSNVLSKGTYVGGPSKKWAEGIALAVGEFSKVYDYLSGNFLTNYFRGGSIDPKTFATAIETVAQGINAAAGKVTGPFPKGPSKEWAQGISIVFGEFSKIYDYMSGDIITNFLRGGAVNPEAFVKTIDTVAQGINAAAGRISGPFPKGPTKEWAEGTSLAFGQFSKIYDYMSGDIITNFLRGGSVKTEEFVNTISVVADGINIAAKKISGPFPAGPTKEWAQGMSIAFGEFTKIYDYLSGGFMDRILGGGAINPQEFVNTINIVAEGVNAASKRIKGPYPEGPSEEWATGVSVAFGEFTKIYDYLSGNFLTRFFGGGGISPEEFTTTINTVAEGVNVASKKIQGPFPQGPSKEWAEGMSIALGEFTKIYDFLSGGFIGRFLGTGKVDPEEFVSTISIVADGINMASKKIQGPFPQGPTKEWAQGTSIAFGEFSKMYDYLKGGWFSDQIDPQQFVDSISTIADGINTAAGKIKGPFPQGPTKEWGQAISLSFGAFSEIYDYLTASGFWNGLFSSGQKDPTMFAEAIDTVAIGINAASKRIKGPFPQGPTKEWAEGISTSFGAFSKVYDYFSEGFFKDAVDPDEFTRAIDIVASGINVASKRIQGPFPEGPSKEWAKGTSLAFGEFSKMYSFLDGGFLGSKIEPDDFVYAIETIAEGINIASKKIKGPFPEGPSKEWAKGTSRAFGEFSKIYDYFSGGWFSKPIDADVFSNVINTVADSINIAASKLKGPYGKGPDEAWAKSTSIAFGEFSKIYDYFAGGWFTNPIDSDEFNSVIVTVADAMNTAGGKIKGPFAKGPDKAWSKSIAQTFGAFSQIYDYMSGSWFSKPIDADEFSSVIVTVADAMTIAASKIKGPFNKGPEKGWADGLAQSFGAFSKIYDYMSGGWFSNPIDPDLFKSVITSVAQAMNTAGSTLKGPWTTAPSVQWSDSIAKTFGVFTNLYDYFSKGFVNRIIRGTPDPTKFSKDIQTIALAVNTAASTLKGPYTNPPTVEWADGVSRTFGVFTNLYDYFSKGYIEKIFKATPDPTKFSSDIKNISLAVNTAASTLKGPYTNPPTEEWADGVSRALGVFTNLYDYFSKGYISKFLTGSPDPTKFSTDVATIAAGINTAAVSLKGPYSKPPSKEWSESVALAFGTFTDIYDYLNDQWLSFDIDPDKFCKTIDTIGKGINTAAISLRGEYRLGPKKEWAEGISVAFGAFSDIYDYLNDQWFSTNIDPEEFNQTIQTIADGIVTAAKTLGGYNKFPTGPSKTWAEGVSLAFGAFTDIYDYLNDQWFSSDIDPEKFSETIKTIGSGIKEAAVSLGGAKNYPIGPSETWAKGVSLSFGAFSKIYETLSGGWFTKAIDPEQFKTAIVTISKGLIEAAKELGGKDAVESYKNGPPLAWSQSVAASFGAFTGIFNALNKDSSWFSGGKDYSYYGNAIKSVGQGLVDAANLIGGKNVSYDVNKLPKAEWSLAIKTTMQNFIPALQYISKSEGMFTSGSDKLLENMAAIASSIRDTSKTVSEGDYTTIVKKEWYTNLKDTIGVFTNTIKTITDLDPDWDKMSKLAESVKEVSKIISEGKFTTIIKKEWTANTKLIFNDFISILKNTKNIPNDKAYNQLRNISNNIVWVSKILPKGSYKFMIPDVWSTSTKLVMYDFVSILKKVSEVQNDAYNQLRNVVNNIVWVSKTILKGNYLTTVPSQWVNDTKNIFYQFSYILRNVAGLGAESFDNLRNVGNNIVWVSRVLTRGIYTFVIPNAWGEQLKETFTKFRLISVIASSIQPKQLQSNKLLATTLQQNSLILSKGNYRTRIPKEFNSSVAEAYKSFGEVLSVMKKSGLLDTLTSDVVSKSGIISEVIASVANYFNGASIVFDEKKMPSAAWASGFSSTVTALVPGIDLIEKLSEGGAPGGQKFQANVNTIVESIIAVATKFSALSLPTTTKALPENYFENIAKAIDKYLEIQNTLSTVTGTDTAKLLQGIDTLQKVYDKLATSLDKLGIATKNIDIQKLTAINGLSTSVLNFASVNPDTFKQVLNVLETSGTKAIEKVSQSNISTTGATDTGKTPISTVSVPISNVSTDQQPSKSLEELKNAINTLNLVMVKISNVLGDPDPTGGSTLVKYISNKMLSNNNSSSYASGKSKD